MRLYIIIIIATFFTACTTSTTKVTDTMAKDSTAIADSNEVTDTPVNERDTLNQLSGVWELTYISGPRIAFDGLYPDTKPNINFDIAGAKVNGNTSCNNFSAVVMLTGDTMKVSKVVSTKMACKGQGENTFLNALAKIDGYEIDDGNTLTLSVKRMPMMRFSNTNSKNIK